MIEVADAEAAAQRLASVIYATPVSRSSSLSRLSGRDVFVKPEHLQRTGSFKIRGAYNFISQMVEGGRTVPVVAASAGNHAQGVALAASLCGLHSTIFMPSNASIPKLEATRAYGADVVLGGVTVLDCIASAREFADSTGAVYVPPFDDAAVIAGQATIGLELDAELAEVEAVVVPVGGGGLISGVAAVLARRRPRLKVIGVQAGRAASMSAALEADAPVVVGSVQTMADGIAVPCVSELTLDHVRRFVDEIVVVEEEEISRAVLVLLERTKWVVEPAGAVGLAAVLAGKVPGGGPVATVLSGGNIDPVLLIRLIEHGLAAAGRYLMLRVVLDDKPGALARLTDAVATLGLNVLSVDHHRSAATVGIDEVEVFLTVETRDPLHRDQIIPSLCELGFRAESML